jgi:hypothetical protein
MNMKPKTIIALAIWLVKLSVQSQQQEVFTPNDSLREIGGHLYNIERSIFWTNFTGDCAEVSGDLVVIQTFTIQPTYGASTRSEIHNDGINSFRVNVPTRIKTGEEKIIGQKIVLRNYPVENLAAVGKTISCRAMRIGVTNYNGSVLELYDCGKVYHPPPPKPLTPEEIAAAKAKADAAKKAAQVRALKGNQEDADKGDAYGLLRMGERYRDGDGVEKDLSKAREYLAKAANAGSSTAADELSKMNQVSTNSPATQ